MSRGLGKPVAFWKMLHFLLTRGRHAATPRRNPPTCWKAARSFLLINRKLEDLELEKGLSFTGCHSSKENGKIPGFHPEREKQQMKSQDYRKQEQLPLCSFRPACHPKCCLRPPGDKGTMTRSFWRMRRPSSQYHPCNTVFPALFLPRLPQFVMLGLLI